jgi:hypothetical protein
MVCDRWFVGLLVPYQNAYCSGKSYAFCADRWRKVCIERNKKPPSQVVFTGASQVIFTQKQNQVINDLFDFGFFVDHMFTCHGIKFFDFHFFWHVAFVFIGRVEVTGTCSGFEFDFIAHDGSP